MTYQEAHEKVKEVSHNIFSKCSEYEDAFLFENEDEDVAVVMKDTGEVVNITDYILETYRDLEEDLIEEYNL